MKNRWQFHRIQYQLALTYISPWYWLASFQHNMTLYCVSVLLLLLQFTFIWYRRHWPHQTLTCSESTGPRCDKVTSFSPQCSTALFSSLVASKKFRILFKISLLTYKTLHEKQPVYLYSMLAASLPSHSLRSSKEISLWVPGAKTNTCARAFHFCALSLWDNLSLSVHSAISVTTSQKRLKTHLFNLVFPPRHLHSQWPVDAMDLFHRFCWTLIWLAI